MEGQADHATPGWLSVQPAAASVSEIRAKLVLDRSQ